MRCSLILLPFLAFGLTICLCAQHQETNQSYNADEEVLALETNLVVLNLTITDKNERYVSGLKVENFRVLEDNLPQQILSFGFEETSFAAVILLDTSASMEQKLALEQAACADFIRGIRDGDSFAIYSFGGATVKKIRDFTASGHLPDSSLELQAAGTTPLYDAIVKAAEALGRRPERRRAILIVSDGADTNSKASLGQAMRSTIAGQISIYAVDLTNTALYGARPHDNGPEVLKVLAERSGGKIFQAPGGNKLREAFAKTVDELRNQYTITYQSTNDNNDGNWRAIEVRLAHPKVKIRTRQGYFARKKME
jgi:Ca-activated chloride channel homolog